MLRLTSSAPFQAASAQEPDSPAEADADAIKPTPKVAGSGSFNSFKARFKLRFGDAVRVTAATEAPPVLVSAASTTPIHVEGCVPDADQDRGSGTVERYILGGARSFTKVRIPHRGVAQSIASSRNPSLSLSLPLFLSVTALVARALAHRHSTRSGLLLAHPAPRFCCCMIECYCTSWCPTEMYAYWLFDGTA